MRQMLTQSQTAGQYFTNDQIKEMTRKVSAEVDLVHQQTQNQRYGSSHIGATAKDISMSSLMLLLVWLIFFMVLINLLQILGHISGYDVKLVVLALILLALLQRIFLCRH